MYCLNDHFKTRNFQNFLIESNMILHIYTESQILLIALWWNFEKKKKKKQEKQCLYWKIWGELWWSLEKAMASHSSTLAWKIPWMEEPRRLQSMGLLRVGHDWATSLSLFTFKHWRRKWQPLRCSCLENPRDGGAWRPAVYGVTQSWTRLKRLSSSSSSMVKLFITSNISRK